MDLLKKDPEEIICSQAQEISKRLNNMNKARENMLIQLRMLAETAPELIAKMANPDFIQTLKPSRADIATLFDENLVDSCMQCVDSMYQQSVKIPNLSQQHEIDVVAAPAGLLRWSNMLSEKFPGGYRDIAGWMTPNRIWLTWTITSKVNKEHNQLNTIRYDGLVWLDDKWVWLPKIFRYLTPYLIHSANASLTSLQRH